MIASLRSRPYRFGRPVDVERRRFEDLSPREISRWAELQEAMPEYRSPYFRPEFARMVAEVRDDVEVAVLSRSGTSVGFFAYQVDARRRARPIGWPVCDYAGVVASRGVDLPDDELLRACGLAAYAFDHLIAQRSPFSSGILSRASSPVADLNEGYEAYREAKNAESDVIRFSERMQRRLARDGEVVFDWHADAALAETIHRWKRDRYVETGAFDPFQTGWTARLLDGCLRSQGDAFAGGVAALFVGGRPVAANLYLRSRDVVHSWIPAYDPELSASSPGSVLFHETLRHAGRIGMRRLDFGKGDERYKQRLMTGSIAVAEGAVDRSAARGIARRSWYALRDLARASSWGRDLIQRYRRIKRFARPG